MLTQALCSTNRLAVAFPKCFSLLASNVPGCPITTLSNSKSESVRFYQPQPMLLLGVVAACITLEVPRPTAPNLLQIFSQNVQLVVGKFLGGI